MSDIKVGDKIKCVDPTCRCKLKEGTVVQLFRGGGYLTQEGPFPIKNVVKVDK